jgi:ribonuclease T2
MRKLFRHALGGVALVAATAIYLLGERAESLEHGDYYLLAVSWLPSWCDLEGHARGAPQCDDGLGWTVHGLWPQHDTGGWPEYCDTDARDPGRAQTRAMADIMGDGGLAWHQWKKHGRCTGLSADAYFRQTRDAFTAITFPPALADIDRARQLSPAAALTALREANSYIGQDMAIATCRDGNLQEIRLCLTTDLTPRTCGADVLARQCDRAKVVMPAR